MEDNWLWYLAGAMDTSLTITVKVSSIDRVDLGYRIIPILKFTRPTEVESVFGMLDEYCEEYGVRYRVEELASSNRFVVESPDSVARFLKPILPGMVQQRERAEVMLDEFLPLMEDGTPSDKETFMDAIRVADEMRDKPITSHSTKYDASYFEDEWELE